MLTNSDILEHTKKERNELPIAAKLLGKKIFRKILLLTELSTSPPYHRVSLWYANG